MAHKLGMGYAHDLPIPAVSAGNMPDAAWKKAKRDESWTTGDSFNYSIGQGFTLASPLQLAVMIRTWLVPVLPAISIAGSTMRDRKAVPSFDTANIPSRTDFR